MIPGGTLIKKCAACSQLIEETTTASGNTFGAAYWTDGKMDAPMLPDRLWLVECPHCHALLWIDEQEMVGEVDPFGESNSFKNSRPYELPSTDTYLDFLDMGIADPQKERYLRLRAWWSGNDEWRESRAKSPLSDRESRNLQAFARILDETDDNDRLIKAEVMRELGHFDEATALLAGAFKDDLLPAVETIKKLVGKKDPFVAVIEQDERPDPFLGRAIHLTDTERQMMDAVLDAFRGGPKQLDE